MTTRPPVRVTAPASTPVSLEETKAHLRIDHDDDDTLIEALIAAATEHLDGYSGILGRALISQEWRQDFDWFCWRLRLPFPDVSSPEVEYDPPTGAATAFADVVLRQDHIGPYLDLNPNAAWPSTTGYPASIRVTFTAGYGATADTVPAPIRAAILLIVGDLYANRETAFTGTGTSIAIPMSMTVDRLLAPYRRGML